MDNAAVYPQQEQQQAGLSEGGGVEGFDNISREGSGEGCGGDGGKEGSDNGCF